MRERAPKSTHRTTAREDRDEVLNPRGNEYDFSEDTEASRRRSAFGALAHLYIFFPSNSSNR